MIFWGVSKIQLTCELVKSLQNKKGQKKLRYPTKRQSFSAFLLGISNLFGPSYFEAALVMSSTEIFRVKQKKVGGKLGHFNFWVESKLSIVEK